VLAGFALRSDVKIVRYPDRYMDPRGAVMWRRVLELIEQVEQQRRRRA
jgi:DNA polymerase-1